MNPYRYAQISPASGPLREVITRVPAYIVVFAFIHILIGPNTGYLSDLSVPTLMAALGVFALFGAFSILFWAYFRFRPARHEDPAEG